MKKCILFDLNGLFITAPLLSDRFQQDFGVDPNEFIPVLKNALSSAYKPDAKKLYSYWKEHLKKWNVELNEQEFYDYWFKPEHLDKNMVALAKELKQKGYKLYVVSNNVKERTEYYMNEFTVLQEIFENIYYSWQVGYRKPDHRYFKKVLEMNDLNVSDCVYFDDSRSNVESAMELGIESYLYKSVDQVRADLSL